MKRVLVALLAATATSLLFTAGAGAVNTITVNSKLDNGDGANCTLREAIANANNNNNGGANGCAAGTVDDADGDDIRFANVSGSPDTFALTGAAPLIAGTLNIAGNGTGETIVDGDGSDTVLRVSHGTVEFTGFAISGGGGFVQSDMPTALFKRGGGVYNSNGNLTLDQMRIADNLIEVSSGTAGRNLLLGGGGVFSGSGPLTVTDSLIEDNDVHATQTNADGSGAQARGGGIYTESQLTIANSTIDGNRAETDKNGTGDVGGAFGIGGGVYADGPIDAARSTFSNNTVDSDATGPPSSSFIQTQGGGIAGTAESGGSSLELVTVAGNRNLAATTAGSIFANNAGGVLIENTSGTFAIASSTIADNGTDSEGVPGPPGKNLRETGAGTVTLTNTIVADPYSGNPANGGANCIGNDFGAAGFNVDYSPSAGLSNSCGLGAGTIHADPALGPLADNGGGTLTMALDANSPAIDKGRDDAQTVSPAIDQRGLTRPSDFVSIADAASGDGSDIGAFELQAPSGSTPPPVTTPAPVTAGPTGQRAAALKKCKKKKTKKAKKKCRKKAKKLPV